MQTPRWGAAMKYKALRSGCCLRALGGYLCNLRYANFAVRGMQLLADKKKARSRLRTPLVFEKNTTVCTTVYFT